MALEGLGILHQGTDGIEALVEFNATGRREKHVLL